MNGTTPKCTAIRHLSLEIFKYLAEFGVTDKMLVKKLNGQMQSMACNSKCKCCFYKINVVPKIQRKEKKILTSSLIKRMEPCNNLFSKVMKQSLLFWSSHQPNVSGKYSILSVPPSDGTFPQT